MPLTELKSAGLLLNRLSRNGDCDDMSSISWIPSACEKENEHINCSELSVHVANSNQMVCRIPDVKKKVAKKSYDVNISSINSAIYDENWATKQANSFTDWMNFTFTNAMEMAAPTGDELVAASEGIVEGNANGLKILLQKRGEAIHRQKCFQLYHSSEFIKVLKAVEAEVCEGRLVLREDRDILADLGLQEELFGLLFSYEMPWMRLCLEIVFGEIISIHSAAKYMAYPCKSNCPKWKTAIKTFVMERMLSSQDLVAQYTKQQLLCVSHEKKLRTQTRQHLLKKFLAVILLLDTAKRENVLKLPTLFVRTAVVKSSKEVILTFSREIMRGEGDVIRHLGLLGYGVSFAQTFIDEFDYTVKNLAVRKYIVIVIIRIGVAIAEIFIIVKICLNLYSMYTHLFLPV
jgi:hypothetical protein